MEDLPKVDDFGVELIVIRDALPVLDVHPLSLEIDVVQSQRVYNSLKELDFMNLLSEKALELEVLEARAPHNDTRGGPKNVVKLNDPLIELRLGEEVVGDRPQLLLL